MLIIYFVTLLAVVNAEGVAKRAVATQGGGNWYDKDNWRNSDSMTYVDQQNNPRSRAEEGSGAGSRPSDTIFDGSGYGPDDEDAIVDASGFGPPDDEDTVIVDEGSGGGVGVVQTHKPVWHQPPVTYRPHTPYKQPEITTQRPRPKTTTEWRFEMTREKDTVPWYEQVVTTAGPGGSWWTPEPETRTEPPRVEQTTLRQDYDVQVGIADPETPLPPEPEPRPKPTDPTITSIYDTRPDLGLADPLLRPGILAAVIGGAVVGLLAAILLVMFIVYRMRKMDEGSYALEEPKSPPQYGYAYHKAPTKEFYA